MKKKKIIIAVIFIVPIITYICYAIYLLISHPTNTYIIKEGSLSQEENGLGYVIRNEVVINGQNNGNGIYAIALEGEKVAYNEPVFRYYSNTEKEISNKINKIDYQIQELLEAENSVKSSADVKAIENQIESEIANVNQLKNYQEINECKRNIDTLISKKINFIKNITENNEIKELIDQRNEYENQLKNVSEYIIAPISGIVSYRVDGLEEKLTVNNFSEITEQYLNDLDLKTEQVVATSNESGKVIDNFKCYIAMTMNSEQAMNAEIGDKVKLRVFDKQEIDATIKHINEEYDKRTIIFETNKMTEDLISHRKIEVNVIWWSATGLKVPNQALIEENGLYYVIRNKAGSQSKILVKIKAQTDKFSLITTYSTEELQELGYDEEYIKGYKKISNYDEIMIKTK